MDAAQRAFLSEVLGEPGAAALERAAVRDGRVAPALLPRAALALVEGSETYTGPLGSFAKAERGYFGRVVLRGRDHEFEGASAAQVAAALSLALGVSEVPRGIDLATLQRLGKSVDALVSAQLRKGDVLNFPDRGRGPGGVTFAHQIRAADTRYPNRVSVNMVGPDGVPFGEALYHFSGRDKMDEVLVHVPERYAHASDDLVQGARLHAQKATGRAVRIPPPPAPPPAPPRLPAGTVDARGRFQEAKNRAFGQRVADAFGGLKQRIETGQAPPARPDARVIPLPIDKTEEPGQTAGPKPQLAPDEPAGPKLAPSRTAQRQVRVAKSAAGSGCPLCHRAQMSGAAFVGCLCFRDLCKSVSVTEMSDAYELALGDGWDDDAAQALAEAVGNG